MQNNAQYNRAFKQQPEEAHAQPVSHRMQVQIPLMACF